MSEFARIFREERIKQRKTLRDVGEYVGKSIGYLSDIEHDRKPAPDLETARKIEEFLFIDDDRLVLAASRERKRIPTHIIKGAVRRPAFADLMLRADEFTDEELQAFLASKTKAE